MYKLVILIENLDDISSFEEAWPQFLHHAESMPGLLRETTSRVDSIIFGEGTYAFMHELYFKDREQAQKAMVSTAGQSAGKLLQSMTEGRLVLFFADHKEDDLENIRKYRAEKEDLPGAGS